MLVKPCMYSPVALPSRSLAAPAKKRKQSTIGGISSDLVGASGLPTFSDSIRASSSPPASIASASFSNRSLRSRGVLSDQTSSNALRAAVTARSTSFSVPFGTCAMTLPVAGLMISWTPSPVPGVHSPPIKMSWRRSVVLIGSLPPSLSSDFSQRHAENVQPFFQLLIRNGERHQCANDVVMGAGAQDDQTLFARDGQNLRRLFVGRLFRLAVAHELHAGHCAHHADVAGKWEARGEALRHRDEVGLHAGVLDGEELARAAEPGLDLIRDEEDAVALGELTQLAQEVEGCGHGSALAQDGLDDDRGDSI